MCTRLVSSPSICLFFLSFFLPLYSFIICFNTVYTLLAYLPLIILHTSHLHTSIELSLSSFSLSLSLSLSHTHTHTHRRAHTFFHKLTPTTPPPLSLTHSLTTLSCISPPLLLYSSSPPLLLLLFIQFFEHLEEMVIYDTGRVCARALIQELVIDMPVQPLPAPTPLGSPDGEGCYVMLCYDMLC